MKRWPVLLLVAGSIVIWSISCENTEEADPTPPVLSVTPVDISGPYDPATITYGDIKMVAPAFIPFGSTAGTSGQAAGFEYYTVPDAPVRAVCRGRVEAIVENPIEQGDYEIQVVALPGSAYKIIYDHVLDVRFLEDQTVDPGDILGLAGTWNDTMRRVTLQVLYGSGSDERAYCPLNYGDSAFNADHNKLLNDYNQRGISPVYDSICLDDYVYP